MCSCMFVLDDYDLMYFEYMELDLHGHIRVFFVKFHGDVFTFCAYLLYTYCVSLVISRCDWA